MVNGINSFKSTLYIGFSKAGDGISLAASKASAWGKHTAVQIKSFPIEFGVYMQKNVPAAVATIVGTSLGLFAVAHGINSLIEYAFKKLSEKVTCLQNINVKIKLPVKLISFGLISGGIQAAGLYGIIAKGLGYPLPKVAYVACIVGAIALEVILRLFYTLALNAKKSKYSELSLDKEKDNAIEEGPPKEGETGATVKELAKQKRLLEGENRALQETIDQQKQEHADLTIQIKTDQEQVQKLQNQLNELQIAVDKQKEKVSKLKKERSQVVKDKINEIKEEQVEDVVEKEVNV
jgi:hypothetical protein